ncbi:MAG: lysylphosphatidylglycerol synthase transmembrane domain-containing protein [Candidatus Bathyarchaeota archaeon]
MALAGLLLLGFFLFTASDLEVVLNHVVLARKAMYSLAFLSLIAGVVAYTASWYVVAKTAKLNLSFNFALATTWSSIFFNIVTPTASVGGEIARIYFVSRKNGEDYGNITATVLLHRVACTIPFLTGSVVGLAYLLSFYKVSLILFQVLVLILAVISVILTFTIILYIKPNIFFAILLRLIGFFGRKQGKLRSITKRIQDVALRFDESFKNLKAKRGVLVISVSLAFVSWIFDVAVAYFVFLSLNYSLSFSAIIFVYTIGMTIQMLPVGIPGMIGVVETIMPILYNVMGVPLNLGIAATLMIRLVMLWFQAALGGIFTLITQKTLK